MEGEMRKEDEEYQDTNNNNDYICNNQIGEDDEEDDNNLNSQAWGTWEELLLACAVKRHGFANWDSVAMEVRSRTSVFVSVDNCRLKYRDLKSRFRESTAGDGESDASPASEGGEERIYNIPWLEQLRSLRVAELRREVQLYDDSILSLQLKVKKLEEEREVKQKPDLKNQRKVYTSRRNDDEKVFSTAEESDRENRSMNEFNSTASGGKPDREDEPCQASDYSKDNNPDPDSVYKAVEERTSKTSDKSGMPENKWKRRKHTVGNNNHGDGDVYGEIRSTVSKSQPLIGLLDLIRSHPRGSLFERRLRSQETKEYKSLVKQHLDMETIQRKLKKGSYEFSSFLFYRDLQLLFTNAIVYFSSSSSESMAAYELRTLISEEMRKETGKSGPRLINKEALTMSNNKPDDETSDSSLSRQKSSAPLVVCKRRSLVSASKEETLSEDMETGLRSSRRVVNKAVAATNKNKPNKGKKKQTETKDNKEDTEKKMVSSKKKSVADFLKRLENSPQKEESKSKPRKLRSNSVGKKKVNVENTPVKRTPGRPQKKTVETAVTGKRGRESGSSGKDHKQPKKRNRR